MGLVARTDFRPTGTPTRAATGQPSGSLLGAAWEAWRAFVASVLAAGQKIVTDSGNPYEYAFLNPGVTTPAERAALAAYNEAVTALRGASGGSGGQSSTFASNLMGYDPAAGAAQGQAAVPALLNQTDALGDQQTRGLTLADQLAGGRPAIGVPKPLRRQVKKARL